MVFGVGEAVGVISLSLTALHGCVKGLAILSKASHYERDVSNVRLQIELEQNLLFTWAEAAGLTQEPPTLLVNANDAAFVPKILSQLDILLSDLHELKKRYGLDLKPTAEEIETLDDENSTLSRLGPKPQESVGRTNAAIFNKRKSPWKRLRWVTLDEKKIGDLLEDIKGYITKLEKFLEQPKQAVRGRYLDGILRDALLNVNDPQKLEIIGRKWEQASSKIAIAAAARLKRTRLKLGLVDSSHSSTSTSIQRVQEPTSSRPLFTSQSSSSSSHSMRQSMRLLTLTGAARAHNLRTLTYYDNSAVLLEWKSAIGRDQAVLDKRVNQVASFLKNLEPSFHSLPCRGYVKDYDANRYGYIFDLPEIFQPAPQPGALSLGQPSLHSLPDLQSLRQLFDQSAPAPSLNEKLSISLTLLENLLNLHTSGWLHKELRSDNIIFVRKGDRAGVDKGDLSMCSMYIAGYVYARADDPGEVTEPLESEVEADLYRHPLSLGGSRRSFCKSFDIFGVGCILLEIGLWSSLHQILERHSAWALPLRPPNQIHQQQRRQIHQNSSALPSRSTGTPAISRPNPEKWNIHKEDDGSKSAFDLMQLRHELLLSQLGRQNVCDAEVNSRRISFNPPKRCKILQLLESATGEQYTSIVEEFLLARALNSKIRQLEIVDEHEYALDLEMKARNIIQAITNVI